MDNMGGDLLQQAEQFLKDGNKQSALPLLVEYIRRNPNSARGWWMLSFAVSDPQKQIECVERILQMDPGNASARARLEKLKGNPAVQSSSPAVKHAPSKEKKNGKFLQYAVLSVMGCAVAGLLGFSVVMIAQRYQGTPLHAVPTEAISFTQISLHATWTPTPTSTLLPTHTLAFLTTPLPKTAIVEALPGTSVPRSKIGLSPGFYAPDFSLTDVHANKTVKLSDYEGKAVVIYFWATWCAICKTEMPSMEGVYKGYQDDGLMLLAVNVGESASQARTYADGLDLTFPILNDAGKGVASNYEIIGYPTFYFIEPNGLVSSVKIGGMDYWSFNTRIRELLKLDP
jgi:peroxiredoxin